MVLPALACFASTEASLLLRSQNDVEYMSAMISMQCQQQQHHHGNGTTALASHFAVGQSQQQRHLQHSE